MFGTRCMCTLARAPVRAPVARRTRRGRKTVPRDNGDPPLIPGSLIALPKELLPCFRPKEPPLLALALALRWASCLSKHTSSGATENHGAGTSPTWLAVRGAHERLRTVVVICSAPGSSAGSHPTRCAVGRRHQLVRGARQHALHQHCTVDNGPPTAGRMQSCVCGKCCLSIHRFYPRHTGVHATRHL